MEAKLQLNRLYLLPFDHRQSFMDLLKLRFPLSQDDVRKIKEYKQIIYAAFKQAVRLGLNPRTAGILIDETYGREILLEARQKGFIVGYTLEKSGQAQFALERKDYQRRLNFFQPSFAKILLHYYHQDKKVNLRQAKKIAAINRYLKQHSLPLLLEILIVLPAKLIKTDLEKMRLNLTIKAIQQLRQAGVNPLIWKLEGFKRGSYLKKVADQVLAVNSQARIIILGRNEKRKTVERWLAIGAKAPAVIGFAIGRTIFEKPLHDFMLKKITRKQTIQHISNNYLHFVKLFEKLKTGD